MELTHARKTVQNDEIVTMSQNDVEVAVPEVNVRGVAGDELIDVLRTQRQRGRTSGGMSHAWSATAVEHMRTNEHRQARATRGACHTAGGGVGKTEPRNA